MKTGQYLLLFVVTALLAVELSSQPSLAQEELVCESDVIVQEGDWLSAIAERELGDPTLYEIIATATNQMAQSDNSYATIASPDVIEPGWKLCIPGQVSAAAGAAAGRLTPSQLANATYSGIYDEPVSLTEGRYEGEPYVEGDPSRPIVEYINRSEQYGDLDGDGVEDAVVFLDESGGGTGHFVYVAAQLNQNGQPVDAGAVWIEDRIQIISAAIENGRVNLEITAEGPGDAACCKSYKTHKSYALQNGQLAELPGEEMPLERISVADLDGTTWTLLELDYEQPALGDTEVTISFEDGQLSGSAGCNSYNSTFTLGDDNPFVMTISPVVSTQMACPEPILNQETAYLAALPGVSQWGYQIGNLALYYGKEDRTLGRLLFAPPAEAASSQLDILTGATWQWISFTDPVQQFDVEQPENYTLTFQPDGMLSIKADCNQVVASYSAAAEGALSVQPGPATLAACPPGSRGEEFVQKLGFAAIYFFQDGHLFIDMMSDGGTLEFSPQGAAEMAAASTSFTYQCNADKSFTAEFTDEGPDGSVNLTLDGQSLTLPRVPSGSGAKYSDGQTTFWTQGDEGFIEVGGEMTFENCVTQVNYTAISLKPALFVISSEARNLYATSATIRPGRFLLVPRRNDSRLNTLKSIGLILFSV